MKSEIVKCDRQLNPFEIWMVRSNLETVKTKGIAWVVNTLNDNGYPKIAKAVKKAYDDNATQE